MLSFAAPSAAPQEKLNAPRAAFANSEAGGKEVNDSEADSEVVLGTWHAWDLLNVMMLKHDKNLSPFGRMTVARRVGVGIVHYKVILFGGGVSGLGKLLSSIDSWLQYPR